MPSFQSFFILSDRPASFGVPALEPVVFLSAAEVQVFEQFWSWGAQEKIRKQKRRMGPRCVSVYGRPSRVGDHQVHGTPRHRRASLGGDVGCAVELAWGSKYLSRRH